MSVDFAALVHAFVAGVADVRACLIVSRDGLALGASPADEEEKALAAWSQIAALGEVDRGFVGLRDEQWVFCRRGPYAALAKASSSARAGLILDRLDEMLLVAEEVRLKKESFRSVDREPSVETPRGPRTSLHRELREEAPGKLPPPTPEMIADAASEVGEMRTADAEALPLSVTPAPDEGIDEGSEEPSTSGEVDAMALRREFAGILMPSDKRDEES
jgi:hypothetical protein